MSGSFKNVGQWSETFNNDCQKPHRFVTRFILIRGLEVWKETISFLATEVERHIKLSELCSSDDSAPYLSIERIKGLLNDYPEKRVLIYPISECLRFGSGGTQLLAQLAQLEGNSEVRLYVPLFELDDMFHRAVTSLARYAAGELAPFWRLDGNEEVKLQVSPLKFYQSDTVMVDGFKAYLKQWEEGGAQNIILRTSLLESCCPVIGRFEVAVYHNAFEILNHKLENHLEESWGNSIQWEWLLSRIGNHNSLEKFAAAYFNVLDFEGPKLLMEWHKCDENTKWFVWLWGKVVKQEDELILYLIHNSENYETLLEDLYKVVFHKNLSLSELGYRRELLRIASNTTPPKSFLEILTKTQSPLKKLCYLTGLNSAEKQDIVSCVASLLLESTDPAIWMPYLEIVFPELSYYIQGLIHEDKFLESYFSSYSKSRIINQESNELKALTEKAARNKHYFVFKTRLSSLENHIENNEKIIWFDGLGLEWLGLIKGIVLEQKDVQMDFWPVRTNLPSITETNMSTDEKTKKYRGLDQFAHNYEYSFPEFFVKEIEYVSSSFRTIIDELAPGDSILITSDHGLTPASFNTQTIKGLSDVKPLHWGRDAEYQATIHELGLNEDLFINDGNRIFLANHGRLFGGAGCHGQIHGGATLEEALVPIIRLTKIAGVKATLMIQAPEIIVEKIKLDRHGSGVLRFRIFGAPKIVHVRIGMTRLVASVVDGNVWEVKLAGMNAGKMEAHVEQDNAYVGSIKFETTKGIKEVDLGL